ncbi:MAG: urease accessory protein UreE [Oscillospiraceae bacterium]|nr:urease accessory protein UreE [Oscillospiraceae bacterium]
MIAEKILGNIHSDKVGVPVDTVELEWFEADGKRLRKTTSGGRDIGIAVGEKLRDGDILYLDNEVCIAVTIAECELTEVKVSSMEEMGRVCFEIGNRHLPLKISADKVLIPYDGPTEQHLKNLGFSCGRTVGSFGGHIVCKVHGHEHHHHG